MPPEPAGLSRHEVEAKLKQLRDVPLNTAGAQDKDMLPLHAHLMRVRPGGDGVLHWFCPCAEPLTRELAVFLLRLHAYDNSKVVEWRKRMTQVWRGCADCIRCMDEAKSTSRTTYFGAFSDVILSRFWVSFEKFEIQTIVEALTAANITPDSSKSLADVSSPLLYHILSKPAAFSDPFILDVISSQPFLPRTIDWPMDPPPPGYFLLVMHEHTEIRDWASEHIVKAKPINREHFYSNYDLTLQIFLERVAGNSKLDDSTTPRSLTPLAKEIDIAFPFTKSQVNIWSGFASILHIIPREIYESYGLHRVIMSHLHDNSSHFREVLRSLFQATKKLSKKLWAGESADYPQVVFDSIKDNPSYTNLILAHDAQKEQPWFLLFFLEYLRSVWDMQIFGDVLAKFAAFACDELQHERFEEKRPFVMKIAMQILSAALTRAIKVKSSSHRQAIMNVLDIHFDFIVAVSFTPEYAGSAWAPARPSALSLIRTVLSSDVEQLANAAVELSVMEPTIDSGDVGKLALTVRRQVWWKVYTNITGKDISGMSMLLDLAARLAKLDKLSKRITSRTIWKYYDAKKAKPPQELLEAVDSAVDSVNTSLTIIRDGFLDAVTKFANYNTSSALTDALRQNDLAKHLVFLMLSPVEDLRVAAQTLIEQAFDVDVRADCFREILKAMPESSFNGLYHYISKFNAYASKVTEACNVSKALVRCMTDVIEVLGNSPDGLLKDPAYVKRNITENFSLKDELPKLWKVMTTSIAVIFRRTPKWSAYFDNNMMTEWMRDALIFARDLLERRKSFEAATLAVADEDIMGSPRKPSSVGKKMVEDLQDVLLELQGWLRLTDTELLYQSFALLKSLFECFRTAEIKPSAEALAKLSKFIDQNKSSKDSKRVSFLNQADLAELELAVADFDKKDEDEVEIISVSWKSKAKRKVIDRSSSPEVVEVKEPVRRVKQKIEKDPVPDISKRASKSTKQTKLSISGKSSSSRSIVQKPPRNLGKSVVQPVTSTSARRGPKFEGSLVRPPAASASSRPLLPSSPLGSGSVDSDGERGISSFMNYANRRTEGRKEPVEHRKVRLIEDPRLQQARLEAQERQRWYEEARRNAMRLKPDISSLHLAILSWNYDYEGSEPPMDLPALAHIPDSFRDFDEYKRIFWPLLMLEVWSQLVKSKEETKPDVFQVKIEARSVTHPWLDLDVSLEDVARFDWRLNPETDIVLLRHRTEKRRIMAKVAYFRKANNGIMFGLRCCMRALEADPGLTYGSMWNLSLVFSLSTLHREYAALMAVAYYDMADVILRPRLSDPVIASVDEVQQTMKAYQVNEPQAKAIISAMGTKGFSLIQGPPGTGKTWTICGLVGAFLSSRQTPPMPISVPGGAAQAVEKPPVQKLLICAPSNAAIDEVTRRLVEGVRGSHGQKLTPKVVRVGSESQINISAKDVSLDTLVADKMSMDESKLLGDPGAGVASLRAQIEVVKESRQKKLDELQSISNNAARILSLEDEIGALNAKRTYLSQQLDQLRDKQKSQNRSTDAIRRKYRYEILAEADIICSTLSGSGHEQLQPFDFSMVIIDEAAQAIELSSLIPLKYQFVRCVMVGDPQQLPPTVLSPEASKWGYDQSLFVRLQKHRPSAVHLLSIQYRMHPEISLLPSKVFYGGRLRDGPDMDKKTAQPWHAEPRFGVYKFYSVERGREESSRIGHSLLNRDECRMIAALYDRLRRQFPFVNFDYRVGIVSMYRAQVQELRNTFKQRFGAEIVGKVDFNTVDGFQGQEKDIIILSCVRAGTSLSTVGFLSDIRRMNVAITRSRSSLFIFGHAPTLQRSNKTWKDIVDDARSRSCFVELMDTSYFAKNSVIGNQNDVKSTVTPLVQARPAKSDTVAQQDLEPKLFSLKAVKGPTPRKLPQTAKAMDAGRSGSAITAPSERSTASFAGQKRSPDEGGQGSRFRSNDRWAKPHGTEGSPSTGLNQPKPQAVMRPPNFNGHVIGPEMTAAEKELEAFRKRKKQANNPFIKR